MKPYQRFFHSIVTAWSSRLVLLAVVLTAALAAGMVFAAHTEGLFDLDGDPLNIVVTANSDTDGVDDDWDDVFDGDDLALTSVFIADAFGGSSAVDDQPNTGGTHHDKDLNLWDCKTAGISPVKNDITNAFAARYTKSYTGAGHPGNPTTGNHTDVHTYLYFGLDRISAGVGDAAVGFWFFQGDHTCTTSPGVNGQFTGDGDTPGVVGHKVGDIHATSEFTNGGGVSSIKIYKWVGGDNPMLELGTGFGDCRLANGNPAPAGPACATVNRIATGGTRQNPTGGEASIDPPWPYTNNDGGNFYQLGAFFEGGLDATSLNLDLGCGGTFLADTQASQSLTSQIHDFTTGQFSVCSIKAHKYHDVNNDAQNGGDANHNGVIDGAETGALDPALSGWTIFIDKNGDEVHDPNGVDNILGNADDEISGVTNSSGDVVFSGLSSGSYKVCEVLQADWINTDPVGATLCETVTAVVSPGAYVDFGNAQLFIQVVYTCNQATLKLVVSRDTPTGSPSLGAAKDTVDAGTLAALSGVTPAALEDYLCRTLSNSAGLARYDNLPRATYAQDVKIPK